MALALFYPHVCGRNFWNWPERIFNQHFDLDLSKQEDLFNPPWFGNLSLMPKEFHHMLAQRSGASEVKNDANKFEVKLDVSHFDPKEIMVKTVDNCLMVHAKHEEKSDKNGYVSREFTRKYVLPEGCEPATVTSSLCNGVLTIEAPKKAIEAPPKNEREIPVDVQEQQQITDKK